MKFFFIFIAVFGAWSATADDRLLIASGSYDPPHTGHMSFITDVIQRFDFHNVAVSVGYPYKNNSSTPEQTLEFTYAAIENLDYVLSARAIAFKDFKINGAGSVSWINPDGSTVEVKVVDDELRLGPQNALKTFHSIQSTHGKTPLQTYYVVGADSLSNVNARGHESIDEWFDSTHWLVSTRQVGTQNLIAMESADPLKSVAPQNIYEKYTFSSRKDDLVIYGREGKPSLVLFSPANLPDISSSLIRTKIKENQVGEILEFLQPRVREVLARMYPECQELLK